VGGGWEEDAVAVADVEGLTLVPEESASAEDVEQLLFDAVVVGRSRPAAARYLKAGDADPDRAGSVAQERPCRLQVPDPELVPFDLVEMGYAHARNLTPGHATGVETASPGGTRAACSGQACPRPLRGTP